MTLPRRFTLRSLDDLDSRTNAVRSARQLVSDLESDLGGHDQLSAGMHELVTRIALTGALCADLECRWLEGAPINVGHYTMLLNAQRRLLATIGLDRRARDVGVVNNDEAEDDLDRAWTERVAAKEAGAL